MFRHSMRVLFKHSQTLSASAPSEENPERSWKTFSKKSWSLSRMLHQAMRILLEHSQTLPASAPSEEDADKHNQILSASALLEENADKHSQTLSASAPSLWFRPRAMSSLSVRDWLHLGRPLCRLVGLRGVRVGEAMHPGPITLSRMRSIESRARLLSEDLVTIRVVCRIGINALLSYPRDIFQLGAVATATSIWNSPSVDAAPRQFLKYAGSCMRDLRVATKARSHYATLLQATTDVRRVCYVAQHCTREMERQGIDEIDEAMLQADVVGMWDVAEKNIRWAYREISDAAFMTPELHAALAATAGSDPERVARISELIDRSPSVFISIDCDGRRFNIAVCSDHIVGDIRRFASLAGVQLYARDSIIGPIALPTDNDERIGDALQNGNVLGVIRHSSTRIALGLTEPSQGFEK